MKKREAIDTAIISVIDNGNLEADAMLNTLEVLFDMRGTAKRSEAQEAKNAAAS